MFVVITYKYWKCIIGIVLLSSYSFRMARTKITKRKHVPTKDKPWICTTCGTRFMKKTYMNVHMKKFHGENVDEKSEPPKKPEPEEKPETPKMKIEKSNEPRPSTSKFTLDDLSSPDCEILDPGDIESSKDSESTDSNSDIESSEESVVEKEEVEKQEVKKQESEKQEVVKEKSSGNKKEELAIPKEDVRKVQNLYEGRIVNKPTRPMRPLAPVKRNIGKEENKLEEEEDVDEIVVNMKEDMRKRVVLKFPNGKRLQMDFNFK